MRANRKRRRGGGGRGGGRRRGAKREMEKKRKKIQVPVEFLYFLKREGASIDEIEPIGLTSK